MAKTVLPILDELEKGPWPSVVREIRKRAGTNAACNELLTLLEQSYAQGESGWKAGGIVGVVGYGAGVVAQRALAPEQVPQLEQFHAMHVAAPAGFWYSASSLRALCDVWQRHGSGLMQMHSGAGDIVLWGTSQEQLQSCFSELLEAGFDLAGTGPGLHSPVGCLGMGGCPYACYDTSGLCHALQEHFQDEMHRPTLPHLFELRAAGCPNDCVGALARADLALVGTWRDALQIDSEEVQRYAAAGLQIEEQVVWACPGQALAWQHNQLTLDAQRCTRCMHCVNLMPGALSLGKERGAMVLVGATGPLMTGPRLASVLVPFMTLEPPFDALKKLIEDLWQLWLEQGHYRERLGSLIERLGLEAVVQALGLEPSAQLVQTPRQNPLHIGPSSRT